MDTSFSFCQSDITGLWSSPPKSGKEIQIASEYILNGLDLIELPLYLFFMEPKK